MNSAGERLIAPGDLNPPEVQRYVVEHVVRSSDTSTHATHRLRPFSTHEMDYDTWRSGVELVLRDPAISDLQRSRIIRDSLLPPACDMVKHLGHDAPPDVYLQQQDREAAKEQRMKPHLGGTKQKVTTHAHFVKRPDEKPNLCTAITNFIKELSHQMTAIQRQLAARNTGQINRYHPSAETGEKRQTSFLQSKTWVLLSLWGGRPH